MKKVISLLLVATLLTAMLAVSFNALSVSDVDDEGVPYVMSTKEAIAAYEAEYEMEPGSIKTQRIYFMLPNGKNGPVANEDFNLYHPEVKDEETGEVIQEAYDEVVVHKGDKSPSWYNDYNVLNGKHYAGAYWWGGPAASDTWVGYRMDIEDYDQGIYYADIPYDPDDYTASVATAIFNNGVDGGMDSSKPIYDKAAQTVAANIEGALVGDYETLEYGSPDCYSFNNCIYIVNPDYFSITETSNRIESGADWYVYYGNGCYGKEYKEGIGDDNEYPDGTPGWSDNVADMCMNPDHFKDGVHVGYQPDVDDPTEPAPTPTEPAPTPTEPAPTTHVHNPAAAVAENVVPASCTAEGSYDEVVYCLDCGEEISRTHKTIEKTAHNLTYVPVVAATTEAEGVKAHYECADCHKLFSDAAGTIEVTEADLVIPKLEHEHTLQFKPGKKATETADGWKSHFVCTKCGKYFNNNKAEMELTWDQIVIPKLTPAPTEAPTEEPKPTQAPTEAPKPTEAPVLLGDADGDGDVTATDVTVIQRADAGIITATADMIKRGDVDGDGELTILDATYIQRYLASVSVPYGINQPIVSSTPH